MSEKYVPLGKSKFIKRKVYLSHTDSTQAIYYSRYLEWMEAGRMDFLEEVIAPFKEFLEKGLSIMPVKATCEYKRPAFLGDIVLIETKVIDIGLTTVTLKNYFSKEASDSKTLLAEGEVVVVFFDLTKKRPAKVPDFAIEKLKEFEQI